jgi:hypothetical protein
VTTIERAVFIAALPFTILGRFLFVAACLVLDRARRRREDIS